MRKPRDRREATFLEHLEELRQRIIRGFLYIVGATALCWFARKTLMAIALTPLRQAGEIAGVGEVKVKIFEIAGGLVMSLHIAMVAGIILSAPLWLMEFWLFIEPALEDHERKWVVLLLPAAVLLFIFGVGFCYWMGPRAFAILLGFQRELGAAPEFMLQSYLVFFLRLLLIFGAMFELPLVVMFLAAVRIVKSAWLLKHWRIAVVLIALAAAILTPTPDAVTMSLLAGPLVGLYFLSILLARTVEKRRDRRQAAEREVEAGTAPEPDPYAAYQTPTGTEAAGPPPGEVVGDGGSESSASSEATAFPQALPEASDPQSGAEEAQGEPDA
jgi:sec-independent protein translocase protein TatC